MDASSDTSGSASAPPPSAGVALYAITIFLSAFLLFQVQPLVGKYILAWFGGTPAVWTTCMLFFQVLLLGGYSYAHLLAVRLTPKQQGLLHLGLLALALVTLVIAFPPGDGWKPGEQDDPTWRILALLSVAVGAPYLLLASTGPLLQKWFSQTNPQASPYRLYALSNLGSLLALISYPFVFEPMLTRQWQAWGWMIGYAAFVLCCGLCALKMLRWQPDPLVAAEAADPSPPPHWTDMVLWLALSATGSLLLLACTNQLCQDLVVPFLWVLPLSLYLVTFIIAFDKPSWYQRTPYAIALAIFSSVAVASLFEGKLFYVTLPGLGAASPLVLHIVVHAGLMFIGCMICHGELVQIRPSPRYLTHFYLMLSLGGALGGVFVSLVAPAIFEGYWEYNLAIVAAPALLWLVCIRYWIKRGEFPPMASRLVLGLSALGLIVLGTAAQTHAVASRRSAFLASRNFYGVLRVRQDDEMKAMIHGNTRHGIELLDPAQAKLPLTYFSPTSGIGRAFQNHPRQGQGLKVGVIGLGIGTMAAYLQPGDELTFYEINPQVTDVAEQNFGFLKRAREQGAKISVLPGDARIVMERQIAAGQKQLYDLLVLDAFSSDAIPMHLVTRECYQLYLQLLRPDGVLAAHISNRFLDLSPVVYSLAKSGGQQAALIIDRPTGKWLHESSWILISSNEQFLKQPGVADAVTPWPANQPAIQWTDDFSNLYDVLKTQSRGGQANH